MGILHFKDFNLKDYVNEYVAHKLFDVAFIGLKHAIRRINKQKNILKLQTFNIEDCQEYIQQHLEENIRWATNISFRDYSKAKSLTDIFVDLDLFITPRKLRIDSNENIPTIPINGILSDTEKNLILLGQPGAGKTTSVKKLFLEVLQREHDEYKTFNFPIVIKLKELSFDKDNNGLMLFNEILRTIGISYTFEGQVDESLKDKILLHIGKDFIERLDILIILDGYDEISDDKARNEIISNLRSITTSLTNSKFILTSRSADYNLHIDNTEVYEICPLNESQIETFISKWLGDPVQSRTLYDQLVATPYWDTTIRPLTLAHLCALYERNNSIPEKPKSVYKKIIQLLLEDWSSQASIRRKSKYSKFEVDRKMDFLSRFAFELTVTYNRSSFDGIILRLIYNEICVEYGLPVGESTFVINEIESHNGLILQTGSNIFEFAHKSLLEYLVADHLIKLPSMTADTNLLLKLPNELAILVSISSNANSTLFELIINILKSKSVNKNFLKKFIFRLIIEKPDFDPSPLYALTYIYLLNAIAAKIHSINNDVPFAYDQKNLSYTALVNKNSLSNSNIDDPDDKEYGEIEYAYDNDDFYAADDDFEAMNDEKNDPVEKVDDMEETDNRYEEEEEDETEYLLECADIIISFKSNEIFRKSMLEVKKEFTVGEIALKRNSPGKPLEKWGKTFHLKPNKEFLSFQKRKIKMPDNLIAIEDFIKIRK